MQKNKKDTRLILFSQSYVQVLLVVANTTFISDKNVMMIAICSFLISYVWTLNVVKIATSNKMERIIYSTGAMCGGLSGYLLASLIS